MKVNILGHSISATNDQLAYQALSTIFEGKHYITVNNVHTVVEGVRNPAYKQIINNAAMALPDGMPLVKVARWKGATEIERVFGPTFFEKTLEWGQKDGLRHFFFGSSEETQHQMQQIISERFPDAIITGMIAPPFRPFTAEENEEFVQQINDANPDIIWVSLGAPKQEFWMYKNYQKLHRGVMIGIGAGFDYLAGNTRHAPEWMKNASLEWLYRLLQEPRRLWKRYLVTNTLFIILAALELMGVKRWE